jgi:hypothetical protein
VAAVYQQLAWQVGIATVLKMKVFLLMVFSYCELPGDYRLPRYRAYNHYYYYALSTDLRAPYPGSHQETGPV